MVCNKCNKPVRQGKSVNCTCGKVFHTSCYNLTDYDMNLMLTNSNVLFMCDDCINYRSMILQKIEKIESVVVELNENKKTVEEGKIEEVRKTNNQISYAEMVKRDPVIVLKPKKSQASTVTKAQLKNQINPVTLDININGVSEQKGGAVAVYCEDENSVNTIKAVVADKLKENYEVFIPKNKNPKLKIVGMSDKLNEEELINSIRKQNIIVYEEQLKFIRSYETKKRMNNFNAIVEVNIKDFNNIMRWGKLKIQWDSCKVYEAYDVMRCFKCLGYNHKKEDCNIESKVCLRCGGDHLIKECNSEDNKCVNCVKANDSLNLNDHLDRKSTV